MPRKYKPTILIDFDGTIGQYDGKFQEGVVGRPMLLARKAIYRLLGDYEVVIFTTRPPALIEGWLREFGFPTLEVTNFKRPALLILDDRAIQFKGEWDDLLLEEIRNFRPWWQAAKTCSIAPAESSPSDSAPTSSS